MERARKERNRVEQEKPARERRCGIMFNRFLRRIFQIKHDMRMHRLHPLVTHEMQECNHMLYLQRKWCPSTFGCSSWTVARTRPFSYSKRSLFSSA